MGTGGGIIDAGDKPSAARLNQKTLFVGTGAQIAAIGTTYPGMQAFCTSTGSGFNAESLYERNAADDAWVAIAIGDPVEENSTPVTTDADFTNIAGERYYAYFTLPSTAAYYIITGIEWYNGGTVAGEVIAGVDVVDADPPTLDNTALVAIAHELTQSGVDAVQRSSLVGSSPIPAGTICGAWIMGSSSSATFKEETGAGSQNQEKVITGGYSDEPVNMNNDAFVARTARKYIKVYFKGYV